MTVAKVSVTNRGVRDMEAAGLRYLCEVEITRLGIMQHTVLCQR
jgi:hypothetical protein